MSGADRPRPPGTSPVLTKVLVVGGGLVGLSTALFLSRHGVECTVVERHEDVLRHPRMRSLAPRLVEMYRQVGLEPGLIRAGDAFADHAAFTMVRADTLTDVHTVLDKHQDAGLADDTSPCRGIPIDQDRAERLVRERAMDLGADVRFGVSLVGFTDDGTGVTARLRAADGTVSAMTAEYLVAADGANSATRLRMDIGMTGPGEISRMLSILFEADLGSVLRDRSVHMAFLASPHPQTFLMSLDGEGRRWVLGTTDPGDRGATRDDCEALVHAALGKNPPLRILPPVPGSKSPALRFGFGAAVADRFRAGRVFLVGDAAHHMPPPGGFGGATGVADAHNLAWKLAEVLSGRADPALLDTYHSERHPVAEFTMRQALARASTRLSTDWADPDVSIIERTAVMMGYRYGAQDVVSAEPAAVGTRFPHLWLPSGESTLDLFGSGFVLLTSTKGEAWSDVDLASLTVRRLTIDLPAIDPDGAILVRPDGFVAWRSRTSPGDPQATIDRVLTALLNGHSPLDNSVPWRS